MTLKEFRPMDTTGPNHEDMYFRSYATGPQGQRYELFREKHHTDEDVERCKKYLRANLDVVSIVEIFTPNLIVGEVTSAPANAA